MTDERKINAGLTERAHHAGDGKPAAPRQRRMLAKILPAPQQMRRA